MMPSPAPARPISATPLAATPIVATMIGDPAGIGPEVCVKALATGEPQRMSRPLLIGHAAALQAAALASGLYLPLRVVRCLGDASWDDAAIPVLDPGDLRDGDYRTGQPCAASGHAVFGWMRLATSLADAGDIQGWIMGPIDSGSMKASGRVRSLDDLQPPGTFLFRVSGSLRVVPITEHIPLRDVPATVTQPAILALIRLVDQALRRWGVAAPRIGVAGLNPHAMGQEDDAAIAPAVQAARNGGLDCCGPVSPDTVFRQGIEGRYDAVVSMYHDQGQIALKSAAFEGACSIYLGLPYVHLSVSHGTAMDIAGQGVAQSRSMLAAMTMAAALAGGRGFLHQAPAQAGSAQAGSAQARNW